jgi:DNA replication and repair protein RecF
VRLTGLQLRDFRSYERASTPLGEGLTVVHGANGAGKSNLLEALYFGCTARSPRTSNERELVRFGAPAARVVVDGEDESGAHQLSVGFAPGEAKRLQADGAPVERLLDVAVRPLLSVFLPDRLELVKGPPALRRAHLDQLVAALWPARAETRRAFSRALAQRNALLARARGSARAPASLDAWDHELARHAIALAENRAAAVALLRDPFAARARSLGLSGAAIIEYRPRSTASDAQELIAELIARRPGDLARGLTGHGPHRDEVALLRDGHELRAYGSQGEQRMALLALLLAERAVLHELRGQPPVMLLDDVMSELDETRRTHLAHELAGAGQSLLTTTELGHVPGAMDDAVMRLRVAGGTVERT